jgi:hypothetical protein
MQAWTLTRFLALTGGPHAAKAGPGSAASHFKHTVDREAAAAREAAEAAKQKKVTREEVDAAGLHRADAATGLDLPSPLQLFMIYDQDRSGCMGEAEFKQMLYDLDGLQVGPWGNWAAGCAQELSCSRVLRRLTGID